ncbi:MAG TPA: MFS transporter [Thermoanaerobaculia bacterium]|nr:MFS transporter [Thermoanaerobaculia bacterium]
MTSHDSYAALRVPNFRRLILSYATSSAAREAQIVVVGWQVYDITKDPLALGLIGLAEALPFIATALYAGHVADRANRRTLALAGTCGLLLSAIALLVFTWMRITAVWPIYLVIFLSGIGRSFARPAVQALSADLVPREIYSNAVAWRSSTWQFAAVFGPAVGGMLYGFAGPAAAYAVVCVFMMISIVAIAWIQHNVRPAIASEITVGESLRIGLKFVWNEPVVLAAMTLDLFAVLFGGAAALLPIFARMLSAGPEGLGILRAAPAVGSFFVGISLAHRPPFRRAGRTLFLTVAAFGVCIILFAVSRNFYLSLVLLTFSGMFDQISVVIRGTLIQIATPAHLLGRVAAVNGIFIGSSNEIGAFESGVAARLMGTVPSVIFGGTMTLVVVAIIAIASPKLRQLRELT